MKFVVWKHSEVLSLLLGDLKKKKKKKKIFDTDKRNVHTARILASPLQPSDEVNLNRVISSLVSFY
eukprot:gene1859-1138_t